jgi:hypothetical protein
VSQAEQASIAASAPARSHFPRAAFANCLPIRIIPFGLGAIDVFRRSGNQLNSSRPRWGFDGTPRPAIVEWGAEPGGKMQKFPITIATRAHEPQVASILTLAFSTDPLMRWMYPEPLQITTCFPDFVSGFGSAALDHGSA